MNVDCELTILKVTIRKNDMHKYNGISYTIIEEISINHKKNLKTASHDLEYFRLEIIIVIQKSIRPFNITKPYTLFRAFWYVDRPSHCLMEW